MTKEKNGILVIFLKEYKLINDNTPKIRSIVPKKPKMLSMELKYNTNNNPKVRFKADCINKTFFSFLFLLLIANTILLIANIINKTPPINIIMYVTIIIVRNVNFGKKMANKPMISATIPLINELCDGKYIFFIMFFVNL